MMSRKLARIIVVSVNMAVVRATSPHLMSPLARLSIAQIHWKNRTMTIPRMTDQTDKVSVNRRVCGRGTDRGILR